MIEAHGNKKIKAFVPLFSVLIKQVFIGLLPITFIKIAIRERTSVAIIEIAKYFRKFLKEVL